MQWLEHDAFTREFKKLGKKYAAADQGLKAVKKLLAVQFDPIDPREVIAPAKIHRRHQNAVWELWKIEMMIVGLRPSQWPRVWFVVSGDTITFLTAGTHMQNYDDNAMDKIALQRISDFY
jgi:hypothetical protein